MQEISQYMISVRVVIKHLKFLIKMAVAYAYISYQTAFLKANFPLEFFVALLNLEINNTDKLAPLVQEAKNCEIKIAIG